MSLRLNATTVHTTPSTWQINPLHDSKVGLNRSATFGSRQMLSNDAKLSRSTILPENIENTMVESILEKDGDNVLNTDFDQVKDLPRKKTYSDHSQLKLALYMDRTLYLAGGEVSGRLEVDCLSSKSLKLGKISIDLVGFEGEQL